MAKQTTVYALETLHNRIESTAQQSAARWKARISAHPIFRAAEADAEAQCAAAYQRALALCPITSLDYDSEFRLLAPLQTASALERDYLGRPAVCHDLINEIYAMGVAWREARSR